MYNCSGNGKVWIHVSNSNYKKDIALKVVVTSKNKQNNYFLRENAAMHKYNVDEHAFSFMVDRSPIVYLIKEGPVAPHM